MRGFVVVSKDEFYAVIGPLDVNPCSEREATYWETPRGQLVGISVPGYARNPDMTKTYMLAPEFAHPTERSESDDAGC